MHRMRTLCRRSKTSGACWLVILAATLGSAQAQTDKPVPAAQTPAQGTQTQQETATPAVTSEDDLKKEEKQRVLAVVPNFNVTYNFNAAPLTAKQKLDLAMHTNLDSVTFVASALAAGEEEVHDQFGGYGWGMQGYAKRFGAAYLDNFDGQLWGNALLPIIFRQDPR